MERSIRVGERRKASAGGAGQGRHALLRAAAAALLLLQLAACGQNSVEAETPTDFFPPIIFVRPVATGFVQPVAIAHAGDGSGKDPDAPILLDDEQPAISIWPTWDRR